MTLVTLDLVVPTGLQDTRLESLKRHDGLIKPFLLHEWFSPRCMRSPSPPPSPKPIPHSQVSSIPGWSVAPPPQLHCWRW